MKNTPKGKTQPPVSQYKVYTTPSSTILKKPVPKHKGPSEASKPNTNSSVSGAAWTLAADAGKLAADAGKLAAEAGKLAFSAVKGGIEIVHNQIEHNEKLKKTFACYYTDRKKITYEGTLHFSDNQIVFSTNHVIQPHTRSFFKKKDPKPKVEIKIPFQEVIEIKQLTAENPSKMSIQITGVLGSYAFWGFDDYYKAYNHIYSLLPSSS